MQISTGEPGALASGPATVLQASGMLSERLATAPGFTPSGIGTSIASAKGTRTASLAKPPYDSFPTGRPYIDSRGTDSQLPVRPSRHASHSPQEIWKGTLTRSLGLVAVTESPTSVTSATHSCPKGNGPCTGARPR